MSNEKPSKDELKKKLSPMQYKVTQECGTEPPFKNEYWDNKKDGIYVDVVTGEALFSSLDKFDSGTGWPSFTKPIEEVAIESREDDSLLMKRTEILSRTGRAHLGHVFPDGPGPKGLRYCINSASLRFIPVDQLESQGYAKYLPLFVKENRDTAILSGGCFWGVEDLFKELQGVTQTTVGYTGGDVPNPTYSDITTESTGHAEAVEIVYDPSKISYEDILRYFFKLHDPTTLNQQGNDRGTQYRSAIFYHNEEQGKLALKIKDEVNKSGRWKKSIVTEIVPATTFYAAEKYHQDYLEKNPGGYSCHYLRD